jgi:hypothetical protein
LTENTPAVTDSSNTIEEIYHSFASDVARTVAQTLGLKKNVTAALLNEMYVPYQVIANVLDTSVAYVKNSVTLVRREPKLKQKFGEALAELTTLYKSSCRTQLPILARAESKAVLKYMESPELLIERPTLAKQIKQASGVVFGDEQHSTVNVSVGQIMQNILVEARQPVKAIDVIDAEVVETNDQIVDTEK